MYSGVMNTTRNTRVLRGEAARAGNVDIRTINRWRAQGLLTVAYEFYRGQLVPHYDLEQVRAVARSRGHLEDVA
jgi:hypothetical protein